MDYVAAFGAHKRLTKAEERKGSALAMEFKAVVSPDWLAETGDPRDAANPRVQQLVAEAQAWAESWGGAGSVWAVRYDTDERGAGVVDLFMSPVRQQSHKGGTSKPVISCRKAKDELLSAERVNDPSLKTSGAAMQSSWAHWCQQKLDPRIERGQSKAETGREHVHAEVYASETERAKEAARAALEALEAEKRAAMAEVETERQKAIEAAGERLRIIKRAEAEAVEIRRAAAPRLTALESEVRELRGKLAHARALVEVLKQAMETVMGKTMADKVREWAKPIWDGHPANLNRREEPEPRQDWGGPSGP